ncbi:MAG: DegV family protein [Oscillospiraceae bacterium]|nr:DegV family protein [Oscillospiraceae bacterium]
MSFTIITDTGSDLSTEYAKKHSIVMAELKAFSGEDPIPTWGSLEDPSWIKDVYARLRRKEHITTSCVNLEEFETMFEKLAAEGSDFICISISSGISATYGFAADAAAHVREKYPERKIYVVDSLSASLGQGLFVDFAVKLRAEGKSVSETYLWLDENRRNVCHWFTADDLFFLQRGGRVSIAAAIAGTMLGIKPVLHVDNDGKLIPMEKVRGRKAALKALVDHMEQTAVNPGKQKVFISHGDSLEDCKYVEKLIRERFGTKEFVVDYIKPMIGAHSGPGCIALFFYGNER